MPYYYKSSDEPLTLQESSIPLDQAGLTPLTKEQFLALMEPVQPVQEPPTQFEIDMLRYQRRAAVKDYLLAKMAAENTTRVRTGIWTVADLSALMADPALKMILDLIGTLSFELAEQALVGTQHPLLTPDIKNGWAADLREHFYLGGG